MLCEFCACFFYIFPNVALCALFFCRDCDCRCASNSQCHLAGHARMGSRPRPPTTSFIPTCLAFHSRKRPSPSLAFHVWGALPATADYSPLLTFPQLLRDAVFIRRLMKYRIVQPAFPPSHPTAGQLCSSLPPTAPPPVRATALSHCTQTKRKRSSRPVRFLSTRLAANP